MTHIQNPFSHLKLTPVIYDLETYPNYFLAVFKEPGSFQVFTWEEKDALLRYISDRSKILIGYNNINFDDLILKAILGGQVDDEAKIKRLAGLIIHDRKHDFVKKLRWKTGHPWGRSVDLMQLCFSCAGKASLKEISVRLNWQNVQDLPYAPDKILSEQEKQDVLEYCQNDVLVTAELWNRLYPHVELRYQLEQLYDVDVFSLSEAQVCEQLFRTLYLHRTSMSFWDLRRLRSEHTEIEIGTLLPSWIEFQTSDLQELLERLNSTTLKVKDDKVDAAEITTEITIAGKIYKLGIGGFHSSDKAGIFESNSEVKIIDVDVTSYYPSIILNNNLNPSHLTSIWNNILREITQERIKAKKKAKEGDTTQDLVQKALKIVINSAFGKTGNKYSFMFDLKVMLSVTIIGQLALLMLIEKLTQAGFEILSANTDGITAKVPVCAEDKFDQICREWETVTEFNLEHATYQKYVRQDVNNYVALKSDDTLKRKGLFAEENLQKKSDALVIRDALINYFIEGVPVRDTIKSEKSIYAFLYSYKTAHNFTTVLEDEPLQKTNRWYTSTAGKTLYKIRNTNKQKNKQKIKVAGADSIVLLNKIAVDDSLPADLDYSHYIQKVKETIAKIENHQKAQKIKEIGLYPIPKERKYNPRGARLSEIKEDWDFSKKTGIGTYTGAFCGILGIDIDYPDRCSIYDLLQETLIIWHGDGCAGDVLTGKKRGTLLYRCANENIQTSKPAFLKNHGFEIIYGKKTVQWTGFHSSDEEYHYTGYLARYTRKTRKLDY